MRINDKKCLYRAYIVTTLTHQQIGVIIDAPAASLAISAAMLAACQ